MTTRVDLDAATERAWEVLARELERRMVAWVDQGFGERLLLEVDAPEREDHLCSPYVQLVPRASGLRLETAANPALARRFRLPRRGLAALRGAGWQRPDEVSRNYWCPVDDHEDAALAAMLAVTALRDVHGVLHPAFLVDGLDVVRCDEADVVAAEGPDRLRERVLAAFADELDTTPVVDDDGDLPFRVGSSAVFVRVVDEATVQVFADVVLGVDDAGRAAFEVGVLNRDHPAAQFVLRGDRILMRRLVAAEPFVPEHVFRALDECCRLVERVAADTAVRVGGRCFFDGCADERDWLDDAG